MSAFQVTITPRAYETDMLGHVNNVALAGWIETARSRFLEYLFQEELQRRKHWAVVSLQIDFKGEVFYGEDTLFTITAARAGNSSLTIELRAEQGGRLALESRSVLVCIDGESRRPVAIDDVLRQRIDSYTPD